MSETDDTDDLLLIPPDLFVSDNELIETYSKGPYLEIVDSLIVQMSNLEDRVQSIEHLDIKGSSLNASSSKMSSSMEDYEKSPKFIQSAYSTPQKPRNKFHLPSLPATPTSPRRFNRSRKEILKDIDRFIENSNVPRMSSKTLFNNNEDIIEVDGRIINMKEVEDLLKDIEVEKALNEQRLVNREEELMTETRTWQCGFNRKESAMTDKYEDSSDSAKQRQLSPCKQDLIPTKLDSLPTVKLMSLKDLWNNRFDIEETCDRLREKYEEEKVRREHCERQIQNLQVKSLELQERLAVALEVDQTKDRALIKFHDAWEQIALRISNLSLQRDSLEKDLQELQVKSEVDLTESTQKINRFEEEASNALNLARCSQTQLQTVEERNTQLSEQIHHLESKVKQIETLLANEKDKNQQLNEIIVQKELELKNNKNILEESRKEVGKSKKAIDICQHEFTSMKEQYALLEQLLNDKETKMQDLEKQKKSILADNAHLKLLQKTLQDDLNIVNQQFDIKKNELRNYYQQQVEVVVRDKLKEFQTQLDRAERTLQDEMKTRELSIATTAATHIQQLTEKHSLEVNLLEEKQREEVRLYQMQVTQSHEQIQHLQTRIKTMNEKRTSLAQQLHKVLEVQWLEALKIINSGKSAYNAQEATLNRLYTLQSKSFTNIEEVLSDQVDENERKANESCTEPQLTYRLTETPLTSKVNGNKQPDAEFQKYIQMLLSKPTTTLTAEPVKLLFKENDNTDNEPVNDETKNKLPVSRKTTKTPWK